MRKADLCYLYDELRLGNIRSIAEKVGSEEITNNDIVTICRYACDDYLHWSPEETLDNLDVNVLAEMNLSGVVKYLKLPRGCCKEGIPQYLVQLMYPECRDVFTNKRIAIEIFERVLDGRLPKMPGGFLTGSPKAEENLMYCLIYVLQTKGGCKTARDYINCMRLHGINEFLNKYKLLNPLSKIHISKIEFTKRAIMKWEGN